MIEYFKKKIDIIVILFFVILLFQKTIFSGLLPIPSDTIIGLYNPFRDLYANEYPRGLPFKNFLITDPVRQTYPWKSLALDIEKKMELPIWNPYNFAGTPLLANFQSAVFYPLNIIYLILPFSIAWSLLIVIQPFLAAFFMYLFLRNLKLRREAVFLGVLSFSLSGFSVAWFEWGNVIHTALWLPLILLSIDKIVNAKEKHLSWGVVFLISQVCSFLAGHTQTYVYIFILSFVYLGLRVIGHKDAKKKIFLFIKLYFIFLVLTFIQWYPTLQFILLSARSVDLIGYNSPGWFIPWQNLIQFFVPDFFGNPTTLNYFGIWNYAEFVGFIGIFPLMMAIFALFVRRSREIFFFGAVLMISLLLALPDPIAKIPFVLHLPFFETAQPTRLLFLVDFALSILAAYGFDIYFEKSKKIIPVFVLFFVIFAGLWVEVLSLHFGIKSSDLQVAKSNLILPTIILFLDSIVLLAMVLIKNKKSGFIKTGLVYLLLLISAGELIRFMWKFEPFTPSRYLFPNTKILSYLQKQKGVFRVGAQDSQILPPNFSIMYKIQTSDGYDPLYIRRFGEFAAAYSRNRPDISTPFGFNRIITLQNIGSKFTDLMGVRYIMSLSELHDSKLSYVMSEGQTKLYENTRSFERAFFVSSVSVAKSDQEAIEQIFDDNSLLNKRAVVEDHVGNNQLTKIWNMGRVLSISYSENDIKITTDNKGDGFLVLTDAYYPIWHVKIDGIQSQIYITDYAFRGVVVPAGRHEIEFYDSLF